MRSVLFSLVASPLPTFLQSILPRLRNTGQGLRQAHRYNISHFHFSLIQRRVMVLIPSQKRDFGGVCVLYHTQFYTSIKLTAYIRYDDRSNTPHAYFWSPPKHHPVFIMVDDAKNY